MMVKLRRKNARYPDLTTQRPYAVIGIEADDFRILNDHGRPYLYPARLFEVIDPREPDDWVTELGEDGERYAYPPPLNSSGFFEDFFDGKPEVVATFWQVVNQRLTTTTVTVDEVAERAG
jgi:hypothetical protein